MSLGSVLEDGRRAFAELCTDTCRITRDGDGPRGPLNEATGQYAPPPRVIVYEGPARLQVKADINSNVVEATAGEHEWTYLTAQLQLPTETPVGAVGSVHDVGANHLCEMLAAPHSPSLVGRRLTIQGPYHKSQAVYLRFRVKEPAA